LLILLRATIRLHHARVVHLLERYWRAHPSDLVISVIPLFNRALAESLRRAAPRTAFATVLTDLADFPPHFWMESESEFLICGTERAEQQALKMGHPREHVFRISGMILKPKFYEARNIDIAQERLKLGLHPGLPTGIVLFGGHGSPVMLEIARKLQDSQDAFQLIMICGRNQELCEMLKQMPKTKPMWIEEFTNDVAHFMSLADFFIGKPGPGSISEALQFRLPVIVERNAKTMPQERYNTEWLREKNLGIVLTSFSNISEGVHRLLQQPTLQNLRENAQAYRNRALFEIPAILDEVLERHVAHKVPIVPSITTPSHRIERDAAWASLT
jgi:1,2-diacylglycerol 3-beta-galactosyltransferase